MRRLLIALVLTFVASTALPQAAFYWNILSLDKFSYANGNLSGQSNWVVVNSGLSDVTLSVVSNTLQCSHVGVTDCGNQFNIAYPNDQCSQVQVNTLNAVSSASFQALVRSSSSASTFYGVAVTGPLGATASMSLLKNIAGSVTTLVTATETVNSGDLVGVCAQGTSLYVTLRGTKVAAFNYTDSSIASGQPGIVINANGQAATDVILANWSGIFLGTTVPTGGSGGVAAIKWHPGHYALSATQVTPGNTNGSTIQTEITTVRGGPTSILGYMPTFQWNTIENTTLGVYDFSLLDKIYVQLTTGSTTWVSGNPFPGYSSPRRLGLYFINGWYFSASPGVSIPTYILNSSTYGPIGPDAVHYGYWTDQGSSGACTGVIAALWRPAVMNRLIALGQAIAAHTLPDGYTVDTSPYVEMVNMLQETAAFSPGSGCGTDSSYNLTTAQTQLHALDVALGPLGAGAAFPHTNVALYNNYFFNVDEAAALSYSLPTTGTAQGGPDVFGISSGTNSLGSSGCGLCGLTWGQAAYIGNTSPGDANFNNPWGIGGGTDLRGRIPGMFQVQGTELGFNVYYTPADIFSQLNTTLKATHDVWQLYGPGVFPCGGCAATSQSTGNWWGACTSQATWNSNPSACGGVLLELNTNALSTTACPSTYTGGCNTTMNLPLDANQFRRRLDEISSQALA